MEKYNLEMELGGELRRFVSTDFGKRPYSFDTRSQTYDLLTKYIPESVHSLLPYYNGPYFEIINKKDGEFALILIGRTEGTEKFNREKRTTLYDKMVAVGRFDDSGLVHGDYFLSLPAACYNFRMDKGKRRGEPTSFIENTRSRNAIIFNDNPEEGFSIRTTIVGDVTVRVNVDDWKMNVKTTVELKPIPDGGQAFYSVTRSTYDAGLMLSLYETCGVNEKVSFPFCESVGDNYENKYVRKNYLLEKEVAQVSRLTAKDHPLIDRIIGRKNEFKYTLVCYYTLEGVIGHCYITDQIGNDDMSSSKVLTKRLTTLQSTGKVVDYLLFSNGSPSSLIMSLIQEDKMNEENVINSALLTTSIGEMNLNAGILA